MVGYVSSAARSGYACLQPEMNIKELISTPVDSLLIVLYANYVLSHSVIVQVSMSSEGGSVTHGSSVMPFVNSKQLGSVLYS